MDNSQISPVNCIRWNSCLIEVIDCLKNNYEKRKIKIICTDTEEKELLKNKSDGFYIVPKGNSKKVIIIK